MAKDPNLFIAQRFRRLRRTPALRAMVTETRLSAADFIWPLFITDVAGADVEIASMPGVSRLTVEGAVRAAEEAARLNIPAVCLFPYTDPALKTEACSRSLESRQPDQPGNPGDQGRRARGGDHDRCGARPLQYQWP